MGLNETNGGMLLSNSEPRVMLKRDSANTDSSKSPRGIRGFKLDSNTTFGTWKVQGKIGGYNQYVSHSLRSSVASDLLASSFPDKVRGQYLHQADGVTQLTTYFRSI